VFRPRSTTPKIQPPPDELTDIPCISQGRVKTNTIRRLRSDERQAILTLCCCKLSKYLHAENYQNRTWFDKVIVEIKMVQFLLPTLYMIFTQATTTCHCGHEEIYNSFMASAKYTGTQNIKALHAESHNPCSSTLTHRHDYTACNWISTARRQLDWVTVAVSGAATSKSHTTTIQCKQQF